MNHPLISIVGAGPGDPELLTLKAHKRIINAEIILHDNLVSEEILELAPATAEKVYVGKKFGDTNDQQTRQDKINELLVQYSKEGKRVVRLKSGDPYIYGRAAEEVRYLLMKEVNFEVIPGITASFAAANLCDIPLTERNATNSVLICTGHTAKYDFEQLEALAMMLKSGTSLAMYMGLKTMAKVIEVLSTICKGMEVYVTAVSHVSRKSQKSVSAPMDKILQRIEEEQLAMPIVFIIGEYAYPIGRKG